jgi:hypothetical protein
VGIEKGAKKEHDLRGSVNGEWWPRGLGVMV